MNLVVELYIHDTQIQTHAEKKSKREKGGELRDIENSFAFPKEVRLKIESVEGGRARHRWVGCVKITGGL